MHLPPLLADTERLVEVDALRLHRVTRTATGLRVALVVPAEPAPEGATP